MEDKIFINCQSSIKITDNLCLYFDPYLIEEPLNDADLVFITHDHYDHLDKDSLLNIIKKDTLIIIPESIKNSMLTLGFEESQLVLVKPRKTYTVKNVEFTTIPSYNLNKDYHPKTKNYVGYIVNMDGKRILVSGDTDATKELLKLKDIDIALIPIGGTYTMDYQEAADLINQLKPRVVIPTHYYTVVGSIADGTNFSRLINPEIKCILKIKP